MHRIGNHLHILTNFIRRNAQRKDHVIKYEENKNTFRMQKNTISTSFSYCYSCQTCANVYLHHPTIRIQKNQFGVDEIFIIFQKYISFLNHPFYVLTRSNFFSCYISNERFSRCFYRLNQRPRTVHFQPQLPHLQDLQQFHLLLKQTINVKDQFQSMVVQKNKWKREFKERDCKRTSKFSSQFYERVMSSDF